MHNFRTYNEKYYEKALIKMVWNLENARWALFEIKSDSETGKILKNVIYILGNFQTIEEAMQEIDIDWLTAQLVNMGSNRYLVVKVISKLFDKGMAH